MRIESEQKLDFKDVLIRPKRSTLSSREEVNLTRTFNFKKSSGNSFNSLESTNTSESKNSWTGIPIIASNMDTTGTFEIASELYKSSMLTAIHKYYSLEDWLDFSERFPEAMNFVCLSMGISQEDFEKTESIVKTVPGIKFIMIDVANGYTETFVDMVKKVSDSFPNQIIIAGNVCTGEMVEELILAGASIVKCGIGGGCACITRKQTGVGYPQLSCVIECADSAHGLGGMIISDGGCTCPGDIAKAFGAGADFIMLGGMFSAHKESGGELVEKQETVNGVPTVKLYKEFYGMSSKKAMDRHKGGMAEYRSSEGRELLLPYRGPIKNTVQDILGGLRSACTYIGAKNLKEMSKRTTFVMVTQQLNQVYNQFNA